MIASLVPLVCYGVMCHHVRHLGTDRATALLAGAICWGVTLTVVSELLSAVHALTFGGVMTGWLIVLGILALPALKTQRCAPRLLICGYERYQRLSFLDRLQLLAVVGLAGLVAFTGYFSAPSNLDSMTYHLARVVHWMQDRSLAFYPTVFTAQLYQPPWAELAIFNLQLLSGGDRLAFAVGWMSFVLCLVGVWSIAGRLGADTRGQLLAVVFAATVPGAVLQASSTQNNLPLALWLICFARLLLDYRAAETGNRIAIACGCGAAVGLAMLTKGTAYPLAAPLVVWFAGVTLRQPARMAIPAAGIAVAIAVLLNTPHWWRNYQAFGSPLTPPSELVLYRTDHVSPTLLISNLSRNLALDLATPSSEINQLTTRVVEAEHHLIGLDINDPRITVPGGILKGAPRVVFAIPTERFSEDTSGNPLHLLLIIFACGAMGVMAFCHRQQRLAFVYMMTVVFGYVLFCAAIKWQFWNARLHLPSFVLASPIAGLALSRVAAKGVVNGISFLLLVLTVPLLLLNPGHSLIGRKNIFNTARESQYFFYRLPLAPAYSEAADFLASRNCKSIGLAMTRGDYEYPLWVLLRDRLGRWPAIQMSPTVNSPAAWQAIDCVVILQPQLQQQVAASEPAGPWRSRQFGEIVVHFRE